MPSAKFEDEVLKHDVRIDKIYETEWFRFEAITYPAEKGRPPYYRILSKDSVVMIAVTPEKKIVFVKQFRPAVGLHTIELPAGDIHPGEAIEDAVRREFLEETGFACGDLEYLGSFIVSPDRISSHTHIFFARDARPSPEGARHKEADTETVLMNEEELKASILRGEFVAISGFAFFSLAKIKGVL